MSQKFSEVSTGGFLFSKPSLGAGLKKNLTGLSFAVQPVSQICAAVQ